MHGKFFEDEAKIEAELRESSKLKKYEGVPMCECEKVKTEIAHEIGILYEKTERLSDLFDEIKEHVPEPQREQIKKMIAVLQDSFMIRRWQEMFQEEY